MKECMAEGVIVDYIISIPTSNMLSQKFFNKDQNVDLTEFLNTNVKSAYIKTLTLYTDGTTISNVDSYAKAVQMIKMAV